MSYLLAATGGRGSGWRGDQRGGKVQMGPVLLQGRGMGGHVYSVLGISSQVAAF